MTARERIIRGIMAYAYASARRCGEHASDASREAHEAAEFVKQVMA
jgi:hypothetical protein